MLTIMYVPCDIQLYIQEKEAFINNVLDKQGYASSNSVGFYVNFLLNHNNIEKKEHCCTG